MASKTLFDDAMADASLWTPVNDTIAPVEVSDPAAADSAALSSSSGVITSIVRPDAIVPYDGVSLYEVSFKLRAADVPDGTTPSVYAGFCGIRADGTVVNSRGDENYLYQHFCAIYRRYIDQSETYTVFKGYMRGWGSPNGSYGAESSSPNAPGVMQADTVAVQPIIYLNYNSSTSTLYVDEITVTGYMADTYTVTVRGDQSGELGEATVSINPTVPVLLASPSNVAARSLSPQSAAATWDPVEGAEGYSVSVVTPEGEEVNNTYVLGTNAVITGVTPGSTDAVLVVAQGDGVTTFDSEPASAVLVAPLPELDAPTGLSATNVTDTEADLTWDAVDGATGYEITYTPEG